MSDIETTLLNLENAIAALRTALEESELVEIQNQDTKAFVALNNELSMRL